MLDGVHVREDQLQSIGLAATKLEGRDIYRRSLARSVVRGG